MHLIQAFQGRWAVFGDRVVEQGILIVGYPPVGPLRILATVDPRSNPVPELVDLIRTWRRWDKGVPDPNGAIQRLPDMDCGSATIVPALVNCHTHLEFSDLEEPLLTPGCGFTDWLRELIAHRARRGDRPSDRPPAEVKSSNCHYGWQEMWRAGTGVVGEILSYPTPQPDYDDADWQIGPQALRGVIFHEVLGLVPERAEASWAWASAAVSAGNSGEPQRGLSPHAPYSTSTWLYRQCVALCRRKALPLATHVAESPEELQLLTERRGPLVDLLRDMGVWQPEQIEARSVRDVLAELGQVPRLLVVHGNYLTQTDWRWLLEQQAKASVVYCPQTHHYFQHPPHPWREMLRDGLNVALGTDSQGSSPSLSLWDDLMLLRQQAPEQDPRLLWQMATVHGARALGCEHRWGSLSPGKEALFCLAQIQTSSDEFSWEAFLSPTTRLWDVASGLYQL